MFNKIVKCIFIPTALLLTSCASVPLMSLPKLLSLNMETIDMNQVELAVRVQDNVGIKQGSAELKMNLEHTKTKDQLNHRMVLETIETALTPFLTKQNKAGYTVHRFKMTPTQARDAELFRQKALAMKSKNKGKIDMTMAASVRFCAHQNKPAFDNISMTFYVRIKSQQDFFTLIKEQDLQFDDESKKAIIKNPEYCDRNESN